MNTVTSKSVLIIAHGEPPGPELCRRLARCHDAVLAVDGAIHTADAYGIAVDYLTGDLDSVASNEIENRLEHVEILYTPDQERADLEKAIYAVAERDYTRITVVGALGRRPDHTVANLSLLLSLPPELDVIYADGYGTTRAVKAVCGEVTVSLSCEKGDTISLAAMQQGVFVSAEGLEWPLLAEELVPGTRGVSNRAGGGEVRVTVHTGALLLFHLTNSA
jgi:thiamine pyrophosphokinase